MQTISCRGKRLENFEDVQLSPHSDSGLMTFTFKHLPAHEQKTPRWLVGQLRYAVLHSYSRNEKEAEEARQKHMAQRSDQSLSESYEEARDAAIEVGGKVQQLTIKLPTGLEALNRAIADYMTALDQIYFK